MENLIYAAPAAGVLALIFAWMKASWVSKQDPGDANMVEIAGQIQEGALAFLRAEYRVLIDLRARRRRDSGRRLLR